MEQLVNTEVLNDDKEFFTIEEVMGTLGVSENTLYRYIKKGELSPIKFRHRNYFRKVDLVEYLNQLFGERK